MQGKAASPGAIIVFPHDHEAYGASHAGFNGYGIHIREAYLEAVAETVFKMPLRLLVPTAGIYELTEVQFRHLRWELHEWRQWPLQRVLWAHQFLLHSDKKHWS